MRKLNRLMSRGLAFRADGGLGKNFSFVPTFESSGIPSIMPHPNQPIVQWWVRHAFILLTAITFFATLVYISQSEIKEWDESRNGINAFEMLQRGSWLIPYFEGQVDTWNAKPPLLHWCIMVSYKLFGLNTFAMRLPSLLATIGFFFVFYRLMLYFVSRQTAYLACIILLSCKAVLGDHVGLTADFDSILLLFLFLSTYFVMGYIREKKRWGLIWGALFTGLAFWTKGVAGLILLPSLFAYLALHRPIDVEQRRIRSTQAFMALGVLVLFIIAWSLVSVTHLRYTEPGSYGSDSQLETMWVHDIINRLFVDTSGQFNANHKWHFVFAAFETRLQLWGMVFFVLMTVLVFKRSVVFDTNERDLLILSGWIIVPLGLLLTVSNNQHNWYLAPVYPFVAAMTAVGLRKLSHYRAGAVMLVILVLVQSGRQTYFLLTDRDEIPVSSRFEEAVKGKTIFYSQLPQDILLKLVFMQAHPVKKAWHEHDSGLWLLENSTTADSKGLIGKYHLTDRETTVR